MSDQQLYTLKQINELVQVGFIKADNTSLPKIGLTKPDFLNTIFLSQISSWTGRGMKVIIRTTEKCKDCGLLFNEKNKFNCEKHDRWARRIFINISGLKGHDKLRERIYSDKNDIPLSIQAAIKLKDEITGSIKNQTFNIKRYLPRSRRVYLFQNYKIEYLEKMKWRGNLSPGKKGWISKKHLSCVQSAFKNHLTFFNDFDIEDIKFKHIEVWIDKVKVGDNYKRKLIGYLSHILRWAKKREDLVDIPEMPVIEFKRKKKKGIMEDAQIEILDCIHGEDRPIFEFSIETGRRINEYRALKVRDINLKKKVYMVGGAFDLENYKPFPKVQDHAEEEFPITDRLFEILKQALKDRVYGPDDFVFLNRIGRHYTDSRLRKIYNKARKQSGYLSISLNVFGRHSKGLQLKFAGASDEEIADILGNTPEIVRQTYTHVEAGRKAKILSLLDKRNEKRSKAVQGRGEEI